MTDTRQKRLMELLDGALARPEEERFAFLDAECDDEALRDEIYDLLDTQAVQTESEEFLARPIFDLRKRGGSQEGKTIGPYEVERLLERGGMGAVYLARRADLDKQVALKVIRRGLDLDDDLVRRFHRERRILARLEHPQIARLLDGGTTEDQLPYFVMEYVDGEPIHAFCDDHGLDLEARLELFRQVCAGVQFAHQNLVVHRDLKPANILVTEEGEVKLLDFGIAKLIDPEGEIDLQTLSGQGLMTPRYAAPEQVRLEPVTTATDVYALGVLLYELVTGVGPYRLDTSRNDELARAICDQSVQNPSTAVLRRGNFESEDEKRQARRRSRNLRGDLDRIISKALEKRPDERYRSVQELADDLRRHDEGLPVEAATGTWTYRSAKFVRRHWAEVLVGLIFILTLVVFAWRAEVASRRAQAALDFSFNALKAAGPDSSEQFSREISKQLEESDLEPENQARLLNRLGLALADLEQPEVAGEYFSQAYQLLDEGQDPSDLMLEIKSNQALAAYGSGNYEVAEAGFRYVIEERIKRDDDSVESRKAESGLAALLMNRGRYDEAEELYLKGLQGRIQEDEGTEKSAKLIAGSRRRLAMLYFVMGRFEDAEAQSQQALATWRRLGGNQKRIAGELDVIGRSLTAVGQPGESLEILQQALELRLLDHGPEARGRTLRHLAEAALAAGRLEEATDWLRQAVALGDEAWSVPWKATDLDSLQAIVDILSDEPADDGLKRLESAFLMLKAERGPGATVTRRALGRWIHALRVLNFEEQAANVVHEHQDVDPLIWEPQTAPRLVTPSG